jgi:ABC-type lipoprotein release transport system permease subunit
MPRKKVLKIFGMSDKEATDIVLEVANPKEIPTIIEKIKNLYPDTRVITQNDLRVSYQNIFDYKSGMFLALFIVSAFTFFMIVYDKASGLSSEEKKEIGILKAIGWKIDDILKEKFYEAFIISFISFLCAIILALFFVYMLEAPILRDIFTGYSRLKPDFSLPFVFDFQTIALLFFLTIPLYIAAIIIPSWRVASMDADEVMR